MKQLPILIKREFWEHRGVFLILPAVVTAVFISLLIILLIGLYSNSVSINVDAEYETSTETHEFQVQDSSLMDLFGVKLAELSMMPAEMREDRLDSLFSGVSVLWFSILWVVVFFYLIGSLYDDRRDRSILFWKSMPVSDALTVGSKLAAGLVLAPLIYLGFVAIAHLAIAMLATIAASGQDISVWETIWVSADLVTRWFVFLMLFVFTMFWCLPFFGWVLFVSSWAKSAPLAWVVGVPIVFMLLEATVFNTRYLTDFAREHTFSIEFWNNGKTLARDFNLPQAIELTTSLVIGMVFVLLAIWQRGKADEI
jgi:ABC-2 type transport system permease protein